MNSSVAAKLDRPPKSWSLAEYHAMIAAGIFLPGERLELIAGEIIPMVPQEPPHASTTAGASVGVSATSRHRVCPRASFWADR